MRIIIIEDDFREFSIIKNIIETHFESIEIFPSNEFEHAVIRDNSRNVFMGDNSISNAAFKYFKDLKIQNDDFFVFDYFLLNENKALNALNLYEDLNLKNKAVIITGKSGNEFEKIKNRIRKNDDFKDKIIAIEKGDILNLSFSQIEFYVETISEHFSFDKKSIPIEIQKPLKAFISYSKFDGKECKEKDGINYLEGFKEALSPLIKINNKIEEWDDEKLIPGENWDERITSELKNADIIFLLLSNAFLNTKYITEKELKIALEREENGNCIVIPIIIKKCGWLDVDWLSKKSALPFKGHPIASWKKNYDTIDDAWNEVYEEIKKILPNKET